MIGPMTTFFLLRMILGREERREEVNDRQRRSWLVDLGFLAYSTWVGIDMVEFELS